MDAKTAAQAGKLTGAKYLLVATVDDFQDYFEKAVFEGTGRSATKRVFRFSIVGKIYDSTTGKLLESANFQTAMTPSSKSSRTAVTPRTPDC
ncbi:MAG: hypothetical protein WDM76_17955 [Limisphaerales bacterium]